MATVKTAISLHKQLLKEADLIAQEMKLSRSGLVALALEEYVSRRFNRELLHSINEAHDEKADPAERKYLRRMRQRYRKTIDDQW